MKCVLWPGRDTVGVHDRLGELAGFPILALSPFELRCERGVPDVKNDVVTKIWRLVAGEMCAVAWARHG